VRQNLQTKLTQPNAPDRSQSAHKKAMKSKPIIYHNEDNGLPRQRCYLSKEDTTTHHDVDAGTTTNNDESSVDSVSGEFRVTTTTTTTTASTSTQYDYDDNNTHEFINNPLVVQRPHEEADNNNMNNKSWGWGGNHNEHIPLEDETFHSSSNQRRTSNGTHNSSCSRKFP
jgi:hypothetical protein